MFLVITAAGQRGEALPVRPPPPPLRGAPEELGREARGHGGDEDLEVAGQELPKRTPPHKPSCPTTLQAMALPNSCTKWCNYHLSCQMVSRWSYLSHQRFNKLLGVTFAACPPPAQPPGL